MNCDHSFQGVRALPSIPVLSHPIPSLCLVDWIFLEGTCTDPSPDRRSVWSERKMHNTPSIFLLILTSLLKTGVSVWRQFEICRDKTLSTKIRPGLQSCRRGLCARVRTTLPSPFGEVCSRDCLYESQAQRESSTLFLIKNAVS